MVYATPNTVGRWSAIASKPLGIARKIYIFAFGRIIKETEVRVSVIAPGEVVEVVFRR